MRERRYLEEVETAKYPWGPIEFTLSQGIYMYTDQYKNWSNRYLRNFQFHHFGSFTLFGGDMFLGNDAYEQDWYLIPLTEKTYHMLHMPS